MAQRPLVSMYLNHKIGANCWGLTATPKYDITKDTGVFSPNLIDTTSSDNRMNQSFRRGRRVSTMPKDCRA
jgi:hypothetical protein